MDSPLPVNSTAPPMAEQPRAEADSTMKTKATWAEKINAYERLMRLDKPIGAALLLFPTLIALWSASYRRPSIFMVLLFVVGTVLMRAAGCVINDLWDRKFDGFVERTKDRPLPTGQVRPIEAAMLALVLLLAAALIVLTLNTPWAYAIAAFSLLITVVYPLMKRFFHAPQAVLGIAFSMGIPMAFAVLLPTFRPFFWWLLLLNFFYVFAYDTVYAMTDREDDRRLGLKSSAILLGNAEVAVVMGCYAIYGIGMMTLFYYHSWHQYLFLQCLAWVMFMVDQWLLIRTRSPALCFRAFRRSFVLALVFWLALMKWPPVTL